MRNAVLLRFMGPAAILAALLLTATPAGAAGQIQDPVVTLEYVDVAHYWGWWYYSKNVPATKGDAGDYGAPLDLAFVFNMENPNDMPVLLTDFKFTVAFEEFDLNTVSAIETQWIPAQKTNQIRVHAMFDGRQSLLSLLVTGGFKLKEKGISAFDQLEFWWRNIQDFNFPVHVKEGAAVFSAEDKTIVVPFKATFGGE